MLDIEWSMGRSGVVSKKEGGGGAEGVLVVKGGGGAELADWDNNSA